MARNRGEDVTAVLLRRWKKAPRSPLAVFPEIPGTGDVRTCLAFEHIGQHGGCAPAYLLARTAPTTARCKDVRELLHELRKSYGYKLRVCRTIPRNARAIRQARLASV
jgi:hypothetical protein